jgi:hypothetical protein
MRSVLATLRIGFNILTLKSARRECPPETRRAVDRVLSALARQFGDLRSGRSSTGSLQEIDHAVALLLEKPSGPAEDMLTALVAIGSALHHHGDFFDVSRPSPLPEALRPQLLHPGTPA